MSLAKAQHSHAHEYYTRSSSPFPSPSLIYELNLGDWFPQEREKHSSPLFETHTHNVIKPQLPSS